MNALIKALNVFAAIPLLVSACGGQSVHAERSEESTVAAISYQVVLGKSRNDQDVVHFIGSNNCSPAAEFHFCREAGMALWIDANEIVKVVYLYAGDADGFRRYRGPLPYGLSFYDPMWRVQEKLVDPDSSNALYQAGMPDETASPDHMHYWAVYERLNMTVIYNSPGKDEDAYIYAIVMSQ